MKKCECYHEVITEAYNSYLDLTRVVKEGQCWGTKERDICSCQGDRCKCGFYPHVKQKALKEKQSKKGKADIVRTLQYYLDFNEETGVVYIPKFMVEKMIEELKE